MKRLEAPIQGLPVLLAVVLRWRFRRHMSGEGIIGEGGGDLLIYRLDWCASLVVIPDYHDQCRFRSKVQERLFCVLPPGEAVQPSC